MHDERGIEEVRLFVHPFHASLNSKSTLRVPMDGFAGTVVGDY